MSMTKMDLSFTLSLIKRLVYLLILALVILYIYKHIDSPESYWLIVTAFLFSLLAFDEFHTFPSLVTIVTGFMVAYTTYFTAEITFQIPLLVIFLFIVTGLCMYLRQLNPQYFLSLFIINSLIILSCNRFLSIPEKADKFILICISMIVTALLQLIFFSYSNRQLLQKNYVRLLKNLKGLNKAIFSCLLNQDYIDNIYLYERRLHIQKTKYMQSLERLREITQFKKIKANKITKVQSLLNQFDMLFNNMLNYAQLRRRVSDYTTLSVCSKELTDLSTEINKLIDNLILHRRVDVHFLNRKINNLDDNYHHVLQIASREPLVFLLFIESLRGLSHTIEELSRKMFYAN